MELSGLLWVGGSYYGNDIYMGRIDGGVPARGIGGSNGSAGGLLMYPSVVLKADVYVTGGNGTSSSPYQITT